MTYAIIRTGGKQYRVRPGQTLRVPTLLGEAGTQVTFNEVLLGSDGSNVRTGIPTLSGATVTGEIVRHGLGEKIAILVPAADLQHSHGRQCAFGAHFLPAARYGAFVAQLG